MFYKLKSNNWKAFNFCLFEAEVAGLAPDTIDTNSLTFEIGTGSIEKVSRLVKKHKLEILAERDYGYAEGAYIRGEYL